MRPRRLVLEYPGCFRSAEPPRGDTGAFWDVALSLKSRPCSDFPTGLNQGRFLKSYLEPLYRSRIILPLRGFGRSTCCGSCGLKVKTWCCVSGFPWASFSVVASNIVVPDCRDSSSTRYLSSILQDDACCSHLGRHSVVYISIYIYIYIYTYSFSCLFIHLFVSLYLYTYIYIYPA